MLSGHLPMLHAGARWHDRNGAACCRLQAAAGLSLLCLALLLLLIHSIDKRLAYEY
jgi:hypothetical protein